MEFFTRLLPLLFTFLLLQAPLQCHSASTGTVAIGSNTTDRAALLAFKAAITDDPRGSMSSWNETIPFCQWDGVGCSNLGGDIRVTSLALDSMDIQGLLSPAIGNLTRLTELVLPVNRLSGAIPPELSLLRDLQRLNLSFNSFNQPLPPSIGFLSSLQSLDLSYSGLVGDIPSSLGGLSRLAYLDLSSNHLSGSVPTSFRNLDSLRALFISNNSLTGTIPPVTTKFSNLSRLDLSRNLFAGNISSLMSQVSLTVLNLSLNNLTDNIPNSLGGLVSLTYLDLARNNFNGMIPSSITNLSSLITLDLSQNNLEGSLPEDLGHLTSLVFFHVAENTLSGTIPLSLYNITSLQTLSVANNRLAGRLPINIGDTLPNIEILNMAGNQLDGLIPTSLGNATFLRQIHLSKNNFTGLIPASLGSLKYLTSLLLGFNNLRAREASDWVFLSALANCSSLEILSVSSNDLRGELPTSIVNLSAQLTWLTLGNNQISGTIPPGIDKFVNMTTLGFNENLLSGSIPASVGKLQKLEALMLYHNKLSGEIPSSMGNLTRLTELYLHYNDLEGEVPVSLGNCQGLNELDLSNNHLSGSIPKEIVSIPSLSAFLDLSHNRFTGNLPPEVGKLRSIQFLDVSNNRLAGEIPTSLGDCQSLEFLYLSHNLFEGTIPSSLGMLKGIEAMDFSSNNLSGSVPDFLAELPYLQRLNLSFNELDGELPKDGVFANDTEFSIIGNSRVCGGIESLHLQSCPSQASKKRHSSIVLKVVIPISVILSLLVVVLLILHLFGKPTRHSLSPTASANPKHRVSYMELLKATDEFSSDNLVGVGGFGFVYKGVMSNGEFVAIKILNLQQPGAAKSFMAECETLRNIRHRNLVRILTTCDSLDFRGNEFKALVFEFMSNGTLEKWLHLKPDGKLHSKRLSLLQRIDISMDVAAAMDYLHNDCKPPIVHCDLKPSNILLDDDMTAHVGDFGLAKFLDRSNNWQSSTSVAFKGSIGYVAPEYGGGGQASTHADVYSYGVIILELFTGRRPTDSMFADGLTLCKFVKDEIGKGSPIASITDPSLLTQEHNLDMLDNLVAQQGSERTIQCLESLILLGLVCTRESPRERCTMKEVVHRLEAIKSLLLRDLSKL